MHVLVVEDDAATARWLVSGLRKLGYQPRPVHTGAEALAAFPLNDIVLLDLNLPDMDGLEVCRNIRQAGDTPVIAFTEESSEAERVLGLRAGADDCMDKPYGLPELAARIEALMRRAVPTPRLIELRGLRIDAHRREVTVDGAEITMTRKEFDLLYLLASHPERVFPRAELMAQVWQESDESARRYARASRTLDTHVGTLRQKLGARRWIVTMRGVGFRFGPGPAVRTAPRPSYLPSTTPGQRPGAPGRGRCRPGAGVDYGGCS
ncbi:response regulator transcription factor [Krasilnikovia sp. MM14-A1004]|uniref:response regulator transcription factor n=1 Tax=Krasilnikovia sp. MM14-A1004 TaxID=3373541 RepID=UPI00399D4F96